MSLHRTRSGQAEYSSKINIKPYVERYIRPYNERYRCAPAARVTQSGQSPGGITGWVTGRWFQPARVPLHSDRGRGPSVPRPVAGRSCGAGRLAAGLVPFAVRGSAGSEFIMLTGGIDAVVGKSILDGVKRARRDGPQHKRLRSQVDTWHPLNIKRHHRQQPHRISATRPSPARPVALRLTSCECGFHIKWPSGGPPAAYASLGQLFDDHQPERK